MTEASLEQDASPTQADENPNNPWHVPRSLVEIHWISLVPDMYEAREYGPWVPRNADGGVVTKIIPFDILRLTATWQFYINFVNVCLQPNLEDDHQTAR